jgi:4-hydroxybenzoate polyprenyltransferase
LANTGSPVLAVDLDGTLLHTDTLVESVVTLLRQRPWMIGPALLALLRGRAGFKAWLAGRVDLEVGCLPFNGELLDWLRGERAQGRRLVLVTAADRRIADAVAAHTGLFDEVLASEGGVNLKGRAKAAALVERYGPGNFDYAGNAPADLPVWRVAREAIVVGGAALEQDARQVATVGRRFARPPLQAATVLRALRLHQWVKNLLVFVPILAAHRFTDGATLAAVALAFVVFGLTASAVYLINDLVDLPADRGHPRKCRRPFACGDLPLAWGMLLPPLLLVAAAALGAAWLPPAFLAVLAGYFVLTTAYSFLLKRLPIVDVMTLAGLYTIRVIAGGAAVALPPSFWLLACSMFIFLSLALVKRDTELRSLLARGELAARGRGWHVDDLPLIGGLGAASGIAAVLVLALYIDSQAAQNLYLTPEALWFICPLLLYWVSRLWFKTHRGEMHEDPVVFAMQDRTSLVLGALTAAIVAVATLGVGA